MTGSKIIIILLVFFGVSIIIVSGAYVLKNSKSFFTGTKQPAEDEEKPTVILPLDPSEKGIYGLVITYGFKGKIEGLDGALESPVITLDINKETWPKFEVNPKTQILFKKGAEVSQASASALQPGQDIDIAANYSPKTGNWSTFRVTILD